MSRGIAQGSPDGPKKIYGRDNIRWAGAQRAGNSTSGDMKSAISDFSNHNDNDTITIFDEEFTEVLIDRYGVDPREVDEERNKLTGSYFSAQSQYNQLKRYADNYREIKKEVPETLQERINKAGTDMNQKRSEMDSFNDENPPEWSQYWLVTDGHFHDSLDCSTLQDTTQVGLYAPASGMDPDEAIELAGSRVCTHCTPDAPVDIDSRPSHVMTPEERDILEQRQRREKEKQEKEQAAQQRAQEREKRALAKKLDPKNTLDDEVEIHSIVMSGYQKDPLVSSEVTKVRDQLKREMTHSVLKLTGLQSDPIHESYIGVVENIIQDKEGLTHDQKDQHKELVRATVNTDKFWAVDACVGNVDQMVESLGTLRNGVEELAKKKGKTFDKMMNDVYGKRTWNSIEKLSNDPIQRQHVRDDYDDIVKERFEMVKGWINDPESFRDYLL